MLLLLLLLVAMGAAMSEPQPVMGPERLVIQTQYGDLEMGFYRNIAPATVEHILKLGRLGAYTTNHIFRVDKGFVAQIADVNGGRTAPMMGALREEASKTVPGEFSSVPHTRGILSMARFTDPNSGTSSFSILLGNAPHLDGQYAVFGMLTKGDEVLTALEQLPTKREGIFVMPRERISIVSSHVIEDAGGGGDGGSCEAQLDFMQRRLEASQIENAKLRKGCLP